MNICDGFSLVFIRHWIVERHFNVKTDISKFLWGGPGHCVVCISGL